MPPAYAAIILATESVFSAIGGVIFGIDTITLTGYVGCGLIFGGILLSQLNLKRGAEGTKSKDSEEA